MVAWMLVIHLTGLVFWLGSLLVVTHILAIHTQEISAESRAALGRLEMKLLKGLAHPGAALMVASGSVLLYLQSYALRERWLHLKLVLIVVLIALDLRIYFRARGFQAGRIELQRRECRAWHGIIAGLLLAILVLVLIKPFS
jgi:putative membrane protein